MNYECIVKECIVLYISDGSKADRQTGTQKHTSTYKRQQQHIELTEDEETGDDGDDLVDETSFNSYPPPPPQPPGVRVNNNPFHMPFSAHEVCGISDTLASFTLSGYRQQTGFLTGDEDSE